MWKESCFPFAPIYGAWLIRRQISNASLALAGHLEEMWAVLMKQGTGMIKPIVREDVFHHHVLRFLMIEKAHTHTHTHTHTHKRTHRVSLISLMYSSPQLLNPPPSPLPVPHSTPPSKTREKICNTCSFCPISAFHLHKRSITQPQQ